MVLTPQWLASSRWNFIPPATVSNKPDRRERARRSLLKTNACGNAGVVLRGPVVTNSCVFYHFTREAVGALGARQFPTPFGGGSDRRNSGDSRRENADSSLLRHCEEQSDEAIHTYLLRYDCFAQARNDGRNFATSDAKYSNATSPRKRGEGAAYFLRQQHRIRAVHGPGTVDHRALQRARLYRNIFGAKNLASVT